MKKVTDTSKLSYKQLSLDLSKKSMQDLVCSKLSAHPRVTALELIDLMGFTDPNHVRPRLTELLALNKVSRGKKRICDKSGKVAYTWSINNEHE